MARLPTMVLVVDSVAAGLTKSEGLFEPIGMYFEHGTSRPNRGSLAWLLRRINATALLCAAQLNSTRLTLRHAAAAPP